MLIQIDLISKEHMSSIVDAERGQNVIVCELFFNKEWNLFCSDMPVYLRNGDELYDFIYKSGTPYSIDLENGIFSRKGEVWRYRYVAKGQYDNMVSLEEFRKNEYAILESFG